MPDYADVIEALNELGPCASQLRIYLISLLTEERPPVAALSGALPDYEVVLPRSKNEIAFIRKMTIESKGQFTIESERVSVIMAPLLVPDSYLRCLYDDAGGKTQFQMELRKTAGSRTFIEADPASDDTR
jgi:hypothetical protein